MVTFFQAPPTYNPKSLPINASVKFAGFPAPATLAWFPEKRTSVANLTLASSIASPSTVLFVLNVIQPNYLL